MSDEQPIHEVGARRRRREIREARERERAAQRERESAVRRLSNSSTADEPTPALFDQETTTPKDKRKERSASGQRDFVSRKERRRPQTQENQAVPPATPTPAPQQPEPQTGQPAPQPSISPAPATPFEEVVAPSRSAVSPEAEHYEELEDHSYDEGYPGEYDEFGEWDPEYHDEHIDHDEDGAPVLVGASGYGRGYQTVAPMEGRMSRNLLRQRRAKRRRRNITLLITVVGFIAVMGFLVWFIRDMFTDDTVYDYDTVAGDTVEFEIVQNDGLDSITTRLVQEEIVASSDAFRDAIGELDSEPVPQPGTVELREQMPAEDAVTELFGADAGGDYIDIATGWTIDEALQQVATRTGISMAELQEYNENPQHFGLPEEAENLEGFIAPGEYEDIPLDAEAEEVLQMLVQPTFDRLEEAGITDPDEQWETVIVASLITAEANNSITEERPREERLEDYRIMAGAIHNRIDNPDHEGIEGLLQIDAAVNYGLGLTGDLHFPEEERLNESNEYNTYVHPGLPPGPIAAPIGDTITAAADPADTNAYFWVTVNPVTGETRFNETYAEHEDDVDEFLEFCSDNPGACGPADVEAAEDELDG